MRAVVTGSEGFIGRALSQRLVDLGWDVFGFDLENGIDVCERLATSRVLMLRPDVIFHLAAQTSVADSVRDPFWDAHHNVLGTLHMADAARAVGAQIVFASSAGAIYGECAEPAIEESPLRPLSPYGVSKLAGEAYLAQFHRLHGTRAVTLRLSNVYGPGQDGSGEAGVIAIWKQAVTEGVPLTIFGDGRQVRDYVYVEDVVSAFIAAVGADPGVYNISSGQPRKLLSVYGLVEKLVGNIVAVHEPARRGDLHSSLVDPTKAEHRLGWRATTTMPEGLGVTWRHGAS